jgi:hypothetical protein
MAVNLNHWRYREYAKRKYGKTSLGKRQAATVKETVDKNALKNAQSLLRKPENKRFFTRKFGKNARLTPNRAFELLDYEKQKKYTQRTSSKTSKKTPVKKTSLRKLLSPEELSFEETTDPDFFLLPEEEEVTLYFTPADKELGLFLFQKTKFTDNEKLVLIHMQSFLKGKPYKRLLKPLQREIARDKGLQALKTKNMEVYYRHFMNVVYKSNIDVVSIFGLETASELEVYNFISLFVRSRELSQEQVKNFYKKYPKFRERDLEKALKKIRNKRTKKATKKTAKKLTKKTTNNIVKRPVKKIAKRSVKKTTKTSLMKASKKRR